MVTINENPKKLSKDVIKRAKLLSSSLLADAMDGNNVMDYDIKPVDSSLVVAGTALTIDMIPGDNLLLHYAIYNSGEGYVLIGDGKNYKKAAYLGELMATAANVIDIEGIVIDGLVRDYSEIKKLEFPVFSRGCISSGPKKNGPGKLNTTISCGGVTIEPGDLIVADCDGVVRVPREYINNVFKKAEEKQRYELERLKLIEEYKSSGKNKKDILVPRWMKDFEIEAHKI